MPLIAATYFMVAGGPYGLEDIVQDGIHARPDPAAYAVALEPPTALMVSELATAIPEEGGFYIWVRRGMGRSGAIRRLG